MTSNRALTAPPGQSIRPLVRPFARPGGVVPTGQLGKFAEKNGSVERGRRGFVVGAPMALLSHARAAPFRHAKTCGRSQTPPQNPPASSPPTLSRLLRELSQVPRTSKRCRVRRGRVVRRGRGYRGGH